MPKNGKGMNSPVGMYSYKKNPMAPAKHVPKSVGSSSNPDKQRVERMMQKQQKREMIRGEMGM